MTDQQPDSGDGTNAELEADEILEKEPVQTTRRGKAPPSPTPFDHPLSFPLLLFVLSLWFGYDGFISSKIKSVMFNRVMFGLCFGGFLFTLRIGLNEMRMLRERAARKKAEREESETEKAETEAS